MKSTYATVLSLTTITTIVFAVARRHANEALADDQDSAVGNQFPRELVDFAPYEQNPVFAGRGEGHWDKKIRERGWILREGDLYRMWYSGYEGNDVKDRFVKLGYATSKDGLKWERHAGNPLVDQHWVEDMVVVKHEGRYFMFAEGNRNGHTHLLTSRDGLDWKWQGPLDIRKTDGQEFPKPCGTPFVWAEKGLWYLVYEAYFDAGIWMATSQDLKVWTNVQDDPVLQPGPELYDQTKVAANQVIHYEGNYYLYYHGYGGRKPSTEWTTNVAVSKDLIHWKKFPGNPLLPVSENKSSGILVDDGERFRLYTMHPEVNVHFPR